MQQKEIANLLEKDCLYCMQHELRLRTSCTVQKLTVPKSDCKEQEVYLRKSRKEQVNSKS
jgi:hypothetical protein